MTSARSWDRDYGSHPEFYQRVYGQHLTGLEPVGTLGATLMEAAQSPGDCSDAPTPDLTISWLPSQPVRFTCDLGGGRFSGRTRTNDGIVVAPGAGSTILVEDHHVLRLLALPYRNLLNVTSERGEELPVDGDFGALHAGLLRDPGLSALLGALWDETHGGQAYGALMADGLVLQLISKLLRLRNREGRVAAVSARGGLAPWQVRRTTEYLAEHLAEEVGLGAMAAVAQLSTFHFARAFKQSTGLPPHRYQLRLRLERAQALLTGTDLPVTEIAAMVGYDSPQTYARLFRRELGVSPTEYRREHRV